jgi:uncharacterized phiE125 gp8 family phage protein
MRVIVIDPPAPIVSYEEAVARLRLGGGDGERTDVEAMIAAATAHIDGPDGWLGRSLGPQTLEARASGFDQWRRCSLLLPFGPVITVETVSYIDGAGGVQTVDAATYELLGRELVPAFGAAWPAAGLHREAVRVRYKAGYAAGVGADPLVAKVPEPIKAAILLMVGDLYQNRETTAAGAASGVSEIPMSTGVANLLSPFRVWS